jgi:hypothetical protein
MSVLQEHERAQGTNIVDVDVKVAGGLQSEISNFVMLRGIGEVSEELR